MRMLKIIALCSAIGFLLAACSKSPTQTVQSNGPDNAFTRYAENLSRDEQRARDVADKANNVIAQQQRQMDQAAQQQQQ